MADHVGLGKVARSPKPLPELIVKREVYIHLLIGRTVKGPHRSGRQPARTLHAASEHHERGLAVALPKILRKELAPDVFGVGEHHASELGQGFLLGIQRPQLLGLPARLRQLLLERRPTKLGHQLRDPRVDTHEHQAKQDHQRD